MFDRSRAMKFIRGFMVVAAVVAGIYEVWMLVAVIAAVLLLSLIFPKLLDRAMQEVDTMATLITA